MSTKSKYATFQAALATQLGGITGVKKVVFGKPEEKITTDNHYVAYIHMLGTVQEKEVNNLAARLGTQCQVEFGIMINNTDKTYNELSRNEATFDLIDWVEHYYRNHNDNFNSSVQWWKIVDKSMTDQPKVIIEIRI